MAKRGPKKLYYFTREDCQRGRRAQPIEASRFYRDREFAREMARKGGLETQRRKRERQNRDA